MGVILVVDDEIEACNVMEEYLTSKGHKVYMVFDGKSALEKVMEVMPDIVLLDVVMPGLSGLDVLEQIKKISPGTRVIMVTVVSNEETMLRSFELEALDFITKPFDLNHLGKVLNSALSKTREA